MKKFVGLLVLMVLVVGTFVFGQMRSQVKQTILFSDETGKQVGSYDMDSRKFSGNATKSIEASIRYATQLESALQQARTDYGNVVNQYNAIIEQYKKDCPKRFVEKKEAKKEEVKKSTDTVTK